MRTLPKRSALSRAFFFMAAFIASGMFAAFLARGLFGTAAAPPGTDGATFESGPQVGSKVPGPFHPLNLNGKSAGDEDCLVCRYGNAPVVMVFATRPTPGVSALVKQMEGAVTAVGPAKDDEAGACLIVTETSDAAKAELTKLVDDNHLKRTVLAVIEPRYVKKYQLHPDAEVTVLLYSNQVVRANHVFKVGELTEKAAAEMGAEAAAFLKGN